MRTLARMQRRLELQQLDADRRVAWNKYKHATTKHGRLWAQALLFRAENAMALVGTGQKVRVRA